MALPVTTETNSSLSTLKPLVNGFGAGTFTRGASSLGGGATRTRRRLWMATRARLVSCVLATYTSPATSPRRLGPRLG